jgi:Na+/proline symporter
VLTGLLAGSLVTALFVIFPALRPYPIHAGIYGFAVNAVLLISISALTRPAAPERDRAFLAVAAGADGPDPAQP